MTHSGTISFSGKFGVFDGLYLSNLGLLLSGQSCVHPTEGAGVPERGCEVGL